VLQKAIRKLKRALIPRRAQTAFPGLLATAVLLAATHGGLASPVAAGITPTETVSTQHTPANDFSTLPQKEPGQRIRFGRISLEQGLSQISVNSILHLDGEKFL
jgi:hypothetical protein